MRSLPVILFVLPVLAQSPLPTPRNLEQSSGSQSTSLLLPTPGQSPLSAPWGLELPLGDQPGAEWCLSDDLCKLVAGGDLLISTPDPRIAEAMRNGLKRPMDLLPWALLNFKGQKVVGGRGVPRADKIKEALSSAGYRTSWERRETFLRENPEQGEAWLDQAVHGYRLARIRLVQIERQGKIFPSCLQSGQPQDPGRSIMSGNEAAALADGMFKEMADGLDGLMKVPDWTRWRADFLRMAGIGDASAGISPRMRGIAERMRSEMIDAWRREPETGRKILGEGWINLGILLGDREIPLDLKPQPSPPVFGPLRLVRFGTADWAGCWEALRFSDALVPWAPEELLWESATSATTFQQQRYGWGQVPRWALFLGDELLASGLTCPSARTLADNLAMGGFTTLQRLDGVIAREPGHLDARRKRFRLLLARMPHSGLEWCLSEDARRAWIPLKFGPAASWHPNSELWANAAVKILPELEEAIRRWPSQAELWKAWVSWSAFHPRHPSVLNMARDVELWGSHARWIAGFPKEVHEAVADALRSQGAFEAMRQWFREAKDGLGRFPQSQQGREDWMERAKPLFTSLREALLKLHRDSEAAALDREWQTLTRLSGLMRR